MINFSDIIWINDIPVLFPVSQKENFFYEINGNIIFNHDLLKSSFYLLSGFQEKGNTTSDLMGRFEYETSVQAKLNIVHKPIVNYYFEEIMAGIKEYCILRDIEFTRKHIFSRFAFFLTHDIDRVKYYNLNTFLYTTKLLFGLSKTNKNKKFLVVELFRIGFNIINVFARKDPWWNFKYLSDKEKKLGLHSTWFFLPKDQKHVDSYYAFTDLKIRKLMKFLKEEGHETGLHGTVRSHYSYDALDLIKHQFYSATGQIRTGIRQHNLMWKHPDTAINQEKAGIVYDSTLGYAAHEGFRNSYCHPFRLWDFKNNKMLSYWEIPLTVMDATLFHYRKLSTEDAMVAVLVLIKEIKRFNGVFTLLWHNSYLDEKDVPGIGVFYDTLLKKIVAENPQIYTGLDIVNRLAENLFDKQSSKFNAN
jgi:peptidoglycan/xylan/chitin deacetylase (PgdA/CDA1 family)